MCNSAGCSHKPISFPKACCIVSTIYLFQLEVFYFAERFESRFYFCKDTSSPAMSKPGPKTYPSHGSRISVRVTSDRGYDSEG